MKVWDEFKLNGQAIELQIFEFHHGRVRRNALVSQDEPVVDVPLQAHQLAGR